MNRIDELFHRQIAIKKELIEIKEEILNLFKLGHTSDLCYYRSGVPKGKYHSTRNRGIKETFQPTTKGREWYKNARL